MRELLTKHRESPAVTNAIKKSTPSALPWRNFDPIGRWRSEYGKNKPIDASGELPSGEAFKNLADLKQLLLQREAFFARMFTEKLAAYACGRRIEAADRQAIAQIYEPLRDDRYPMQKLIERVVLSNVFRSR